VIYNNLIYNNILNMGSFRFWRRIRILPGVVLNFSKSGVSISFGKRGLKLTIGKGGIRFTTGLPGTGLSYSTKKSFKKRKQIGEKGGS
jgi:hypothetical protein